MGWNRNLHYNPFSTPWTLRCTFIFVDNSLPDYAICDPLAPAEEFAFQQPSQFFFFLSNRRVSKNSELAGQTSCPSQTQTSADGRLKDVLQTKKNLWFHSVNMESTTEPLLKTILESCCSMLLIFDYTVSVGTIQYIDTTKKLLIASNPT